MSEQEVEAHNRRELWRDVANHLTVAVESLGQAQGALEDLEVPHISENLTQYVEGIGRFKDLADHKVKEQA